MSRFKKISWGLNNDGEESYAIINTNVEDTQEYKALSECNPDHRIIARHVYGSKSKYNRIGEILSYGTRDSIITDLDTETVLNEHFMEMI